jgi:raffinose/stachyose/melibiose transport system substrate-binding protein
MKRSVAVLFSAALLFLGLANPLSAQTKELTLLIDNQTNIAGLKAVAESYTQKTGVKITFDLRPGGPEGENVVRTRLAAGDMDDLSYFNSGSLFLTLNPAKNFVDVTNEPFMANVIDSFKSTVSTGGKVYAAPQGSIMGGGWYYNKAIYAKLGLKVPKTWAELTANLEKIKAAKITPVIANKAHFADTPAALRGFEKLQELSKKGYYNKDASSTTFDLAMKMLLDGKGANYPMLTFATATMGNIDPVKINDIGFFAQPGDTAASNGLTIWMPNGLSIYTGSKNIEAARKFLAYTVSPEAFAVSMAAMKPDGPYAVKGITLPSGLYPAVADMIPYVESGKTAPALEFLSPIKGPNLPQICVQDGLGLKSPLDNAKEYDKDVVKQAKQLGLSGW